MQSQTRDRVLESNSLPLSSISAMSSDHLIHALWYATVIPSRITPFSSDHGRQTGLGQISTTLGDHAGISGAVAFLFKTGIWPVSREKLTQLAAHWDLSEEQV